MAAPTDCLRAWLLCIPLSRPRVRTTTSFRANSLIIMALVVAACDRGSTLTDAPPDELLRGVLMSQRVNQQDCAWVVDAAGRRVEVFWPDRWSTGFDPLVVRDEHGRPIANGGDRIVASGYFSEIGASVCPSEALFNVRAIREVEGGKSP